MDIHHLKIFFEACNEKSFTKAARKLYISQSAVSIQIKKLESTLGLQLIERNSKNFKLTFAGKELFKMSQDVFEKVSRMENEMKKILVKHLKEGTVDIALMEEYFIEDKEIKVIETEDYPFVVVAGKEITNLDELQNIPLLKRDTILTNKYLDLFEKIVGFNLDKRISVNGSIETMKNLIKDGLGFAILPYYSVHEEVERGALKLVHKFEKSEDRFQIVLIRENEDKEGISKFVEFLENYKINRDNAPLVTKVKKTKK